MFSLVGTQDNTVVTIAPSITAGGRTAGVPYKITVNKGDSYSSGNSV